MRVSPCWSDGWPTHRKRVGPKTCTRPNHTQDSMEAGPGHWKNGICSQPLQILALMVTSLRPWVPHWGFTLGFHTGVSHWGFHWSMRVSPCWSHEWPTQRKRVRPKTCTPPNHTQDSMEEGPGHTGRMRFAVNICRFMV